MIKPILAAIFSLGFAGVGHLFLGQFIRAIFFIIPALFLWQLSHYWPQMVLANMMLFIFSAVDAFSFGKRDMGIF
jgi:TM2 domain-containing membrane protein YozV